MKKQPPLHLPLKTWLFSAMFLLLLGTVSCGASPVNRPWAYADVRALDPPAAPSPATDILAVYTRTTDLSVDIRVDLLDINAGDQYTLKLALWDNHDFSQAPLKIDISSTGMVQTSGIQEGRQLIWPRVIQNHWIDTITVNLNRFLIGERYRLDISTYTTAPVSLADEVYDIRSDSPPPVNRAPVLVAFWDTFQVTTPTLALRRWDGAHTGPLGDRHGLVHILNGASQYGIPVALLDIKNPASLAALGFMGNVPKVRALYARGLLILPDTAFGEPADVILGLNHRAAVGFRLPDSQFVYASSFDPSSLPGYHAWFLPLTNSSHLVNSGGARLIPLPSANAIEATKNGPALDVRRALINVAVSPDPADLAVLGGSLPNSTWGSSEMAYPTFEWIAAHPWIQPLDGLGLLTFPVLAKQVPPTSSPAKTSWLDDLQSAPENVVTRLAWQTYLTLTSETADRQLQVLQNTYLGQVRELLEAANWVENPAPRTDCMEDLNGDGRVDCILANRTFFAILDPAGARLALLFHMDEKGPHQLVGPSSQFVVGLSDPSEWNPENSKAADPSVIPGAFSDTTHTWIEYAPTFRPDGITFTSPEYNRVKIYRLMENGIQVHYQVNGPVTTRIPLALDPQAFYSGPTDYRASLALHSWTWSLSGGSSVEVRSDATFSANGFTSAIPFLSFAENPNLQYPKGNYLPFPLSVVTIQSDGNFSVEITKK